MMKLNSVKRIALLLALMSTWTLAQEGHPLNGTWSGNRDSDGRNVRVLLIMDMLPNQLIEGTLIENGARIPLSDVTLHHEDWSVTMRAVGKNRAGDQVNYEIEGVIENLGSATEREIAGTWKDGNGRGDFRVRMN